MSSKGGIVPASTAVRVWLGAMQRKRRVETEATFTVDDALRRRAVATVEDGGHTFRIDRASFMGDRRTVSMAAVHDRAWISAHHDADDADDEFDWIPVPEGDDAEEPRYRYIFDVAAPFPRFSDPWRILPMLSGLPGFVVTDASDGGRIWDSIPMNRLPLFGEFGSKPSPVFTARVECDLEDLPMRIDMRLTNGLDTSKYQGWVIVMSNWGNHLTITPPPPERIVEP